MTAMPSKATITYTTRLPKPRPEYTGMIVWTFQATANMVHGLEAALISADRRKLPTRFTQRDLILGGWPEWLPRPDLDAVRRAARIILGEDLALDVAEVVLATDTWDPVKQLQAFREIRDLVTRIEDCRLCGAAGWLDARNKPKSRQLNEVECPDCKGVGKRRVAS